MDSFPSGVCDHGLEGANLKTVFGSLHAVTVYGDYDCDLLTCNVLINLANLGLMQRIL